MSSHHFVREGQEPALLVIDPVDFRLAGPLLEWAPHVMVDEASLDTVLEWGIKIDTLVTRQKAHPSHFERLVGQAPVSILESNANLHPVFDYLISNKYPGVNIVSSDAFIHLEALQPFVGKLAISVISGSEKWSAIATGMFSKWFPAGQIIKTFNFSPVEVSGVSLEQDRYRVVRDGMVTLRSKAAFWVGEAYPD